MCTQGNNLLHNSLIPRSHETKSLLSKKGLERTHDRIATAASGVGHINDLLAMSIETEENHEHIMALLKNNAVRHSLHRAIELLQDAVYEECDKLLNAVHTEETTVCIDKG